MVKRLESRSACLRVCVFGGGYHCEGFHLNSVITLYMHRDQISASWLCSPREMKEVKSLTGLSDAPNYSDRKTRPLPDTSTVTVDVDELWAQMNRAPEPAVAAGAPPSPAEKAETHADETEKAPESSVPPPDAPVAEANDPMVEDMICMKRTYVFAGETITEEKVVSKSSAEGRLHLESQSASPKPITSSNGKPLRRPLKRRSRFDPPPEPGTTGTAGSPSSSGFGSKDKGRKLNTVEKSKLDWAGYVDKTGIKEELTVAEKAKEGYLGKMDFLGRVDAKREDEISNSRKK